jgi:hypothetical protein
MEAANLVTKAMADGFMAFCSRDGNKRSSMGQQNAFFVKRLRLRR